MITKTDPIIAVKSIEASSKWYQQIFGFRNDHENGHFAVLLSEDNEVMLCLHPWGAHEHPTMMDQNITPGNGLILYFRTDNMDIVYGKVINAGCTLEEDIHLNPNSRRKEFSFRDPDGYYLTVTEFHKYEG